MGKLALIFIFILALIILVYYVILLITGKRIASLIKSKDRFIWRGLKNISDPEMPFSRKTNTIFLDQENLVITDQGIFSIFSELKSTGGLENAVAIPLHRIVSFDYKRRVADWNIVIRALLSIWNHLLKVNDFNLFIRFVDEDQEIREYKFKASSLDIQDFEVAFADFDNEIYSGKVKWDSGNTPDEILTSARSVDTVEDTPVFEEKVPVKETKKQKKNKRKNKQIFEEREDETVLIEEPVTEEPTPQDIPPVTLPSDEEVGLKTKEEVYKVEELEPVEDATVSLKDSLPEVQEEPPFEPVEEIDEDEMTVSISQEDFRDAVENTKKKDVLFERPENYKK